MKLIDQILFIQNDWQSCRPRTETDLPPFLRKDLAKPPAKGRFSKPQFSDDWK